MTLLYILCGLCVIYLAFSCAAAVYCLNRICLPIRYDEAHERARETGHGFADALELYDRVWQREPFALPSGDITICGERIINPAPAPGRPRVAIVCHGQTVNRISDMKYAKIFLEEGFHVLVFDERYFGESTASHSTMGPAEAMDIARLMDYARSLYGEDCILALHGESMGAASSILALGHREADLAIEDCPFADAVRLSREQVANMVHLPPWPVIPLAVLLGKLRFRCDVSASRPITAAAVTNTPVCFMHGDADTLIGCAHSKDMYALCKNPASELHLFPGSDHARSIVDHRADYERVMKAFIEKILASPEA